jgi:hypothetical protein
MEEILRRVDLSTRNGVEKFLNEMIILAKNVVKKGNIYKQTILKSGMIIQDLDM